MVAYLLSVIDDGIPYTYKKACICMIREMVTNMQLSGFYDIFKAQQILVWSLRETIDSDRIQLVMWLELCCDLDKRCSTTSYVLTLFKGL